MQEIVPVQKTSALTLLVPSTCMGNIIGKKGYRIKELQILSSAKITFCDEILPNSNERKIIIVGVPDSIYIAIFHLSWILLMNPSKTICYQPELCLDETRTDVTELKTDHLYVPNDLIGCIIGKAGARINEIRQKSGSKIKIDDPSPLSAERCITVVGTPSSNQVALLLLYHQIETEKLRSIHGR
jgi:predicted PilT family ATPase